MGEALITRRGGSSELLSMLEPVASYGYKELARSGGSALVDSTTGYKIEPGTSGGGSSGLTFGISVTAINSSYLSTFKYAMVYVDSGMGRGNSYNFSAFFPYVQPSTTYNAYSEDGLLRVQLVCGAMTSDASGHRFYCYYTVYNNTNITLWHNYNDPVAVFVISE